MFHILLLRNKKDIQQQFSQISINLFTIIKQNYRSCKMLRRKQLQTIHVYGRNFNQDESNIQKVGNKSNTYTIKCKKITNRSSMRHNGKYNEEYQRLQQNDRIIRRIINPKRDKAILKSIQGIKYVNQISKNSQRARTQHHNRNRCYRWTKETQVSQSKTFGQQKYQIRLQNERMGQRIINAKPSVRTLQTASPGQRQRMRQSTKINKGVAVFFNDIKQTKQNDKQNEQFYSVCSLKKIYGFGPTILSINNIKIDLNPPLKNNDLICIELMVNNSNPKLYTTSLFPYGLLEQTQIKFALRLKAIGQYIPIRIWKINGVQNIQIGIVDIQFMKYLCQEQSLAESSSQKVNLYKTIQRNQQGRQRIIVKDRIKCKLRKSKKQQIQGIISIQYMIYRKRYL